jgi:hypothetical protein
MLIISLVYSGKGFFLSSFIIIYITLTTIFPPVISDITRNEWRWRQKKPPHKLLSLFICNVIQVNRSHTG